MAYSRKYFLLRVKAVVEIYIKYHKEGVTNVFIYENYIRNQFGISLCTFYNYLWIPYQKLLKEIEDAEKAKENRPKLFEDME